MIIKTSNQIITDVNINYNDKWIKVSSLIEYLEKLKNE